MRRLCQSTKDSAVHFPWGSGAEGDLLDVHLHNYVFENKKEQVESAPRILAVFKQRQYLSAIYLAEVLSNQATSPLTHSGALTLPCMFHGRHDP